MEWIELGELGKVSTGNTPSKKKIEYYNEKYIELVKPSNFTENMIVSIESGEEYLSKEGKSKGRVAEIGDILVTCIGNIGNVGIASKEVCFNQQVNSIKVDKKKVLSKYVAYSILYIKPALNHVANKAVVPILNKSTFEKIKIPVPPMEIQKKIVEVLDEAQKLIDNRKKQIKLLDDLIESIFYDMFGDPVKNDKRWEVKKLKEESVCIVPARDKPKSFTGNIPWITINDLEQNGYTLASKERLGLTMEEILEVNRKVVPIGCVLMSCVGNLGITSINGIELVINQQIHAFECSENLNNRYLKHYIPKRIDYLDRVANSTTVKYINKTKCENIPLLLPPLPLQNEFAEKVQAIEKQKELLEKSLKLMEDNYNSLMQRAFKGELF